MVRTNYIFKSFWERAFVCSTHKLWVQEFLRQVPCTGYTHKKIPTVLQAPCPHVWPTYGEPTRCLEPLKILLLNAAHKHVQTQRDQEPIRPLVKCANLQHTQCTQEDNSNKLSSCFSSFYVMLSHSSAFTHRMSWRLHNLKLLIATHYMTTEILTFTFLDREPLLTNNKLKLNLALNITE